MAGRQTSGQLFRQVGGKSRSGAGWRQLPENPSHPERLAAAGDKPTVPDEDPACNVGISFEVDLPQPHVPAWANASGA